MINKYEVVKFVDDEFELEVMTDKENEIVWLNTEQIVSLFFFFWGRLQNYPQAY